MVGIGTDSPRGPGLLSWESIVAALDARGGPGAADSRLATRLRTGWRRSEHWKARHSPRRMRSTPFSFNTVQRMKDPVRLARPIAGGRV